MIIEKYGLEESMTINYDVNIYDNMLFNLLKKHVLLFFIEGWQ